MSVEGTCETPCVHLHMCDSAPLAISPMLSGMRQLREIQPDGVHPRVRTPQIRGMGPPLHKIPAHVVKLRPLQDQVGRIIHGQGVHLPDDLLACLGIRHERLLLEELIQCRQGTALVPAPPVGHEELPEGVNGVVKIQSPPPART